MTWFTQSNAKRGIEKFFDFPFAFHNVREQIAEQNGSMVSVKMNGFSLAVVCTALLAGVIISSKYSVSPFDVTPGFAKDFCRFGYATFPMVGILAFLLAVSLDQGFQVFLGLSVVAVNKLRDSMSWTMHPFFNQNGFVTSTMAKVFILIFFNPLVHTAVIAFGVVTGIATFQCVSFYEAAFRVSFNLEHAPHSIRFNGEFQEKSGELLETLPGDAEGNQQPSAVNGDMQVAAKVHRLGDEEFQPISPISARRESEDIVGARSNVGMFLSNRFATTVLRWWLTSTRLPVRPGALI